MKVLPFQKPRAPESNVPMFQGPALERTLRTLLPELRSWMQRFLGPGHDVDDAAQDALIELADALTRFRGESSVRTYAYRIALRVASRHRSRRRPVIGLELTEQATSLDPESLLSQRQALLRLYAALERLTPIQRDVFVLCAIERVHHTEAAETLEINVETLRARLKRARAELRVQLANDVLLGGFFSRNGESDDA